MKIKYILPFFIVFLCFQCKTNELTQIRKKIVKSYSVKYLNKDEFDKSRSLMFRHLSSDIIKNDTIIILESFYSVNGNYSVTIYGSNNKHIERYVTQRSIKKGKIHIDSLVLYPNIPDKILEMVQRGDLGEIKKRGDATTITPAATLIINIGVKNIESGRFDFSTLITQDFSTYKDK